MSQKITPNLWFAGNAKEAVDFYLSVFKDGRVMSTEYYPETMEQGLADSPREHVRTNEEARTRGLLNSVSS